MIEEVHQLKVEGQISQTEGDVVAVESQKVSGASEITKCHYCATPLDQDTEVVCQVESCRSIYCRPCLSRQYKYSRKASKHLPTATWKCPKCLNKCGCKQYSHFPLLHVDVLRPPTGSRLHFKQKLTEGTDTSET